LHVAVKLGCCFLHFLFSFKKVLTLHKQNQLKLETHAPFYFA